MTDARQISGPGTGKVVKPAAPLPISAGDEAAAVPVPVDRLPVLVPPPGSSAAPGITAFDRICELGTVALKHVKTATASVPYTPLNLPAGIKPLPPIDPHATEVAPPPTSAPTFYNTPAGPIRPMHPLDIHASAGAPNPHDPSPNWKEVPHVEHHWHLGRKALVGVSALLLLGGAYAPALAANLSSPVGLPPPVALSVHQAATLTASPFTKEVDSHWSLWTHQSITTKDTAISPTDVSKTLLNPQVKGNEAAATAVMEGLETENHNNLYITPALLHQYEAAYDGSQSWQNWDESYKAAQTNGQALLKDGLLGGSKVLEVSKLAQGPWNDCFNISAFGAWINMHPQAATAMFKQLGPGTVMLHFGGYRPLKITLTQSELDFSTINSSIGNYLVPQLQAQAFEMKAMGEMREQTDPALGRIVPAITVGETGSFESTTAGSPAYAMTAITGHAVQHYNLQSKGETLQQLQSDLEKSVANPTQNALQKTTRMVEVLEVTSNNGVPDNHGEAVMGYNPVTKEVQIWNPQAQGQTASPKIQQQANGYSTMSLDTFYHTYASIYLELPGTPQQITFGTSMQDDYELGLTYANVFGHEVGKDLPQVFANVGQDLVTGGPQTIPDVVRDAAKDLPPLVTDIAQVASKI